MRRLLLLTLAVIACNKHVEPDPPRCEAPELRASPLRLLTRFELDATLRDLALDDTRPARALPVEPLALGLDNNADLYQVTPDLQSRLLDVAEGVAARAVAQHKTELVTCTTEDLACGAQFIESFGRLAFRRPLTPEETTSFANLFEQARLADGFDAAVEQTVTAFLLSPQFLYRLEPFTVESGSESLDPYALASRLSYFLWGSMPDDALLLSARSGTLLQDGELERQAKRLLADPRAVDPAGHFFSLTLGLDALDGLEKSAAVYPAFNPALRASLKGSLQRYLADVFAGEHTLKAALTSNALFVDEALGPVYGQGAVPAGEVQRLEVPERAGLLMQPGFLARLASPDQSSPVRRGVFVLEKMLCETVPPPPPAVMAVPPLVDASSTTRERFDVHGQTPSCSTCHARLDGLGFGFEHFDGIGAFRTTDNGKSVDATGTVISNDEGLAGPFDGAPALMGRLSTSRQVHDCLTSQWARYALGRVETEGDRCSVQSVQQAFFDAGGDFDVLRLQLAKSASFRRHARGAE